METKLITTKFSTQALKYVRMLAALTGEKQYEIVERVLKVELERIQKEQGLSS